MRPRKLVLSGFACFRSDVTVDFTDLDLFAVTGPTGSGKTTLLDAMTFALYARVYRVEGVRPVISPGLKEASVEFEFSVGPDIYKVVRKVYTNRPTVVAFEQLMGETWVGLATGADDAAPKIAALLGLDFDGFTKAVLLPQNAFGTFLQGQPKERRAILEALLGLGIYERIQQRANAIASDRQKEADLLGEQLTRDYADVTAERVEEVERAAAAAGQHMEKTRTDRDASATALALARQLTAGRCNAAERRVEATRLSRECDELDQEIVLASATLADLADAITTLEREIDEIGYDATRHGLLGVLEPRAARRPSITERLAAIDAGGSRREQRLQDLRSKVRASAISVDTASRTLAGSREALETAQRELGTLEERYSTVTAVTLLQIKERQWHEDHRLLERLTEEIRSLESRRAELSRELERQREMAGNAERALSRAEPEQAAAVERAETLRDLETQAVALCRQLEGARAKAAEAASHLAKKQIELGTAERAVAEAAGRADEARTAAERDQAALDELRVANSAHDLRAHLVVGAPCPVCEAKVKAIPAVPRAKPLAAAEKALDRARNRLRTAEEAVRTAADTRTRVATEAESYERARQDAERDAGTASDAIAVLLPEARGGLQGLAALLTAADRDVKAANQAVDRAREAVTRAQRDVSRVEGELGGLSPVDEKRAAGEALASKCSAVATEIAHLCGQAPGERAQRAIEEILTRLADAAEAQQQAREGASSAEGILHQAELERGRLERQLDQEESAAAIEADEARRLVAERDEIDRALRQAGFAAGDATLATIRAEIAQLAEAQRAQKERETRQTTLEEKRTRDQGEFDRVRGLREGRGRQRDQALEAADAAQQAVQRQRAELEAAVVASGWAGWAEAARDSDEEPWLMTVAAGANGAHERAVREASDLLSKAGDLAERLARATECRTRQGQSQQQAQVARELGQILMANRFRDYLKEEAMRTLARDATRHLRELSAGRFAFHHEEGTELEILDQWNADERRSAKTLSGGETFLASLALALGLAEGLPALGAGEPGQHRLESLFIDEGFGTLDTDETLETVAQTLENLQGGQRVVGIVTHLRDLADRMHAQIRVVKTQTGSHVEMTR